MNPIHAWEFKPVLLPLGDERPQPVTILDAEGRVVEVLSADEFERRHRRPWAHPFQEPVTKFRPRRRCPRCGGDLPKAGLCVACQTRLPNGRFQRLFPPHASPMTAVARAFREGRSAQARRMLAKRLQDMPLNGAERVALGTLAGKNLALRKVVKRGKR